MSWLHAVATSEKSGFRLVLVEGQPNGVVVDQNPRAHDKAAKDSTIDVKLEILTSTVPPISANSRLATAEAILQIKQRCQLLYKLFSAY